jgi:hypothetical protein
MNKIIVWVKSLFENKYKVIAEDYKKLCDDLRKELSDKKEVITVIRPPRQEASEEYLACMSSFFNNQYVKWYFFNTERAIIAKFKDGNEPEFCRGALSMIDVVLSDLSNMDLEYKKLSARAGE